MRLSDFWQLVSDEFGEPYGRVLVRDLALEELNGRTAADALSDGTPTRDIWLALCRATDVPKSRWHGIAKPQKQNGARHTG